MSRAEAPLPSLPLWLAALIALGTEAAGIAGLAHWPVRREVIPPEVPIEVSLVSAAALADSAVADAAADPPPAVEDVQPPPPDPSPEPPAPTSPPPVKAVDPAPAPMAVAQPKLKPKHRPKPRSVKPVATKPKAVRSQPAPTAPQRAQPASRGPQGQADKARSAGPGRAGSGPAHERSGSGGTSPAAYLSNPAPGYPDSARRLRQQGSVQLRVLVSAAGTATQVKVSGSSGVSSLDEAAMRAVRRWRFRPARQNGQPISAWVRVPIRFKLNR